jgi:BarA-like signal transduction histidine kinase
MTTGMLGKSPTLDLARPDRAVEQSHKAPFHILDLPHQTPANSAQRRQRYALQCFLLPVEGL